MCDSEEQESSIFKIFKGNVWNYPSGILFNAILTHHGDFQYLAQCNNV